MMEWFYKYEMSIDQKCIKEFKRSCQQFAFWAAGEFLDVILQATTEPWEWEWGWAGSKMINVQVSCEHPNIIFKYISLDFLKE